MKRILLFLTLALAIQAHITAQTAYDAAEVSQMEDFFNQESAIPGKSNGELLGLPKVVSTQNAAEWYPLAFPSYGSFYKDSDGTMRLKYFNLPKRDKNYQPLKFDGNLKLSDFKLLEEVTIENMLGNITVQNNGALKKVHVSADLSLSEGRKERAITISDSPNLFSVIIIDFATALTITGCPNLETMTANSDRLSTIDLSKCTKLERVNLRGNSLRSIGLPQVKIHSFDVSYNCLYPVEAARLMNIQYEGKTDNYTGLLPQGEIPYIDKATGATEIAVGKTVDLSEQYKIQYAGAEYKGEFEWYYKESNSYNETKLENKNATPGKFVIPNNMAGKTIYCRYTNPLFLAYKFVFVITCVPSTKPDTKVVVVEKEKIVEVEKIIEKEVKTSDTARITTVVRDTVVVKDPTPPSDTILIPTNDTLYLFRVDTIYQVQPPTVNTIYIEVPVYIYRDTLPPEPPGLDYATAEEIIREKTGYPRERYIQFSPLFMPLSYSNAPLTTHPFQYMIDKRLVGLKVVRGDELLDTKTYRYVYGYPPTAKGMQYLYKEEPQTPRTSSRTHNGKTIDVKVPYSHYYFREGIEDFKITLIDTEMFFGQKRYVIYFDIFIEDATPFFEPTEDGLMYMNADRTGECTYFFPMKWYVTETAKTWQIVDVDIDWDRIKRHKKVVSTSPKYLETSYRFDSQANKMIETYNVIRTSDKFSIPKK